MENALKPQPLMAEVLPGFASLLLLSVAYGAAHPTQIKASTILIFLGPATVIAGGFGILLICWIVGTFFDTLRDLIESILDRHYPVHWSYLLKEPADQIQKLHDSWLAYYFLNGNMAIGLLVSAGLGFSQEFHISGWFRWTILGVFLAYAWNTWTLRQEIRGLIGYEIGMPHSATYARIGISTAPHSKEFSSGSPGVGVFAIRNIQKGTLIFAPDDDLTITVNSSEVAALSAEFRRLYQDFCPQSATGHYICPLNFNKLTVAWYLNDSDTPNVKADDQLRFIATRDIEPDEELLCSYEDLLSTDSHK